MNSLVFRQRSIIDSRSTLSHMLNKGVRCTTDLQSDRAWLNLTYSGKGGSSIRKNFFTYTCYQSSKIQLAWHPTQDMKRRNQSLTPIFMSESKAPFWHLSVLNARTMRLMSKNSLLCLLEQNDFTLRSMSKNSLLCLLKLNALIFRSRFKPFFMYLFEQNVVMRWHCLAIQFTHMNGSRKNVTLTVRSKLKPSFLYLLELNAVMRYDCLAILSSRMKRSARTNMMMTTSFMLVPGEFVITRM